MAYPPFYQQNYPQNYQQNYQQYAMSQMPQQNTVQSSVVWVGSRAEAESFLVGANNAVTMWDSNGEYVYRKSADASGRPEFHAYKLLEEGAAVPDYVTKEELTKIENRLNSLNDKFKALKREARHESDDD